MQALPPLTCAAQVNFGICQETGKRDNIENLIRQGRPGSDTFHMAAALTHGRELRCVALGRWGGSRDGVGGLKKQSLAEQPPTSSNSVYRRRADSLGAAMSATPLWKLREREREREREKERMIKATCAKKLRTLS